MATGTELVKRTQETVAVLDNPHYLEQVEALLPHNVPLARFVMTAKTAIRTNPDLLECDQNSLFGAIIRCAQAGLYPDGHEAALIPYKGKVNFLPMVRGVIRAARDYGWLMVAQAVYEHDEFDWRGNDQKPLHRHPRPGDDRGKLVAAYAYASQRGETLAEVLYEPDIEKRKKKAQTQNVWNEWPEAMWAKSAAHALYRKLPLSEHDLERFADAIDDSAVAEEALYGPTGEQFRAIEAPAGHPLGGDEPEAGQAAGASSTDGGDGSQQAAASPDLEGAAVPGADDEDPEPQPAATESVDVELLAATVVPSGAFAGKTLADVAETDDGREWLLWALRNGGRFGDDFHAAVMAYVEGALPELWAAHIERSAA